MVPNRVSHTNINYVGKEDINYWFGGVVVMVSVFINLVVTRLL